MLHIICNLCGCFWDLSISAYHMQRMTLNILRIFDMLFKGPWIYRMTTLWNCCLYAAFCMRHAFANWKSRLDHEVQLLMYLKLRNMFAKWLISWDVCRRRGFPAARGNHLLERQHVPMLVLFSSSRFFSSWYLRKRMKNKTLMINYQYSFRCK